MTSMDEMAHPSSGSPEGLSKNSGYENEQGQEEGITGTFGFNHDIE